MAWPSKKKFIFSGFILSILLIIGVQLASYTNSIKFVEDSKLAAETHHRIAALERLTSVMKDIETGQRGYVITGKKIYLIPFFTGMTNYKPLLAEIARFAPAGTEQHRKYEQLKYFSDQKAEFNKKTIALRQYKGFKAAEAMINVDSGRYYMDKIRMLADEIIVHQEAELADREADLLASQADNTAYNLTAILTSIIVLVFIYIQLQRQISQIVKDEEEIRELNIQLKNRIDVLNQINKDLESFSYTVSQDLKSPVRSIEQLVKIIEDEHQLDGSDSKEMLDMIKQRAQKMNYLIQDLLSFSKINSKEIQKEDLDMNSLAAGAIEQIKREQGTTRTSFNIESLPSVRADREMMKNVFYNLISNAVKYSSKQQRPEVKIWSERIRNQAWFFVKDNGAGFDMQHADKLFQAFSRLHASTEFEGNGLGLALVSRVIKKHGGEIKAESTRDAGTVFSFYLPA